MGDAGQRGGRGGSAGAAGPALLVMRHAKSDWDAGADSDHARPLNRRGRRDAPRVAQALDAAGLRPQRVVYSDARRTTETWERRRQAWEERDARDDQDRPAVGVASRDLYLASPGELAVAVAATPGPAACSDEGARDGVDRLMILAHNPGCEGLVTWLSGVQVSMTTANVAVLSPPPGLTWAQAVEHPGAWTLVRVLRPKEL